MTGEVQIKECGPVSVLLLAGDGLAVLLVLLVLGAVEDDEMVLLLAVMTVGRTGKLLVEAVALLVLLEAVGVVRVITPAVVVGAGTGTGPGRSSAGAGVTGVGVAKGAGSAACRFHHSGLLFSVSSLFGTTGILYAIVYVNYNDQ